MVKFHFKLQRLLRVREIGEELARAEFAEAQRGGEGARSRLEAARGDLVRAEQELAQLRSEARVGASIVAERTLPPLLRRIAVGRQRVQAAERAAVVAREAWQASRTEVRALEKLEERARAGFASDERAREDRVLQETIERRAGLAAQSQQPTEPEL